MAPQPPPAEAAEDISLAINATLFSMTILSALFIGARLFVRIKKLGRPQADDYIMLLSLVSLISHLTFPTS